MGLETYMNNENELFIFFDRILNTEIDLDGNSIELSVDGLDYEFEIEYLDSETIYIWILPLRSILENDDFTL